MRLQGNTSGLGGSAESENPVDTIMSTVSTNRALTPERKMEITELADSIQNSNLDDATKIKLLNQLNTLSLGIMLVDDTSFLRTKQSIEAEINAAQAKPSSTNPQNNTQAARANNLNNKPFIGSRQPWI